jgi:hypothetical protein
MTTGVTSGVMTGVDDDRPGIFPAYSKATNEDHEPPPPKLFPTCCSSVSPEPKWLFLANESTPRQKTRTAETTAVSAEKASLEEDAAERRASFQLSTSAQHS